MSKNKSILLQNGSKVEVYPSSLRNTMINAKDCTTEYEEYSKGVYKIINTK